jgi:hypothetical protein
MTLDPDSSFKFILAIILILMIVGIVLLEKH